VALKTAAEYLERLRAQQPEIYAAGRRIADRTAHPGFMSTLNTWGKWVYDAAFRPDSKDAMESAPSLSGDACHTFWHIPTSSEDLLLNLDAAKKLSEQAPASGYTSIGRDALAALYATCWRMDREEGTEYFPRIERYLTHFQTEQLMTAAAITDPKGDRRLRPAEQPDPDAYLHVVARRPDGVVVRGAKMHTSGSVASHELVVIPQRAMRQQDADYAVAFAVPVDTPGIKLVARESDSHEGRQFNPVSRRDELVESFTIFEDVFVPWDRVFMCGEWRYAGDLANTFANVNRQGYLGADVGKLSLYIGAAALIAHLNGVGDSSHIRDKITEMIRLQSLVWSAGVASSISCSVLPPGVAVPDPVIANAGKHLAMETHYTCAQMLLEIAGGAVMTIPSVADADAPELRPYFQKYFRAGAGSAEQRMRVLRFIRDLAASNYAGWWYVEMIHGSGSPAAERIQMYREYDLETNVNLVEELSAPEGG
jgi:4-hydroxybutyryl-CoA dehydratase/vinylacetyl-CoA-Delta-isomerase